MVRAANAAGFEVRTATSDPRTRARVEAHRHVAERDDRHILGTVDPRGHRHPRAGKRSVDDHDRQFHEAALAQVDGDDADHPGAWPGDQRTDGKRRLVLHDPTLLLGDARSSTIAPDEPSEDGRRRVASDAAVP